MWTSIWGSYFKSFCFRISNLNMFLSFLCIWCLVFAIFCIFHFEWFVFYLRFFHLGEYVIDDGVVDVAFAIIFTIARIGVHFAHDDLVIDILSSRIIRYNKVTNGPFVAMFILLLFLQIERKPWTKFLLLLLSTNQKNTFVKVLNLELDLPLILKRVFKTIYLIKKTYDT